MGLLKYILHILLQTLHKMSDKTFIFLRINTNLTQHALFLKHNCLIISLKISTHTQKNGKETPIYAMIIHAQR